MEEERKSPEERKLGDRYDNDTFLDGMHHKQPSDFEPSDFMADRPSDIQPLSNTIY